MNKIFIIILILIFFGCSKYNNHTCDTKAVLELQASIVKTQTEILKTQTGILKTQAVLIRTSTHNLKVINAILVALAKKEIYIKLKNE